MTQFRPRRLDLDSPGIAKVLGACEAEMLMVLWSSPHGSVQDVRAALLRGGRTLSFNATMTILNRLVAKGVLTKRKEQRVKKTVFVYAAAMGMATFGRRTNRDVFWQLFSDGAFFSVEGFAQALRSLPAHDRSVLHLLLGGRRRG